MARTSELIKKIQDVRSSRVICLVTSDRTGLSASMGLMNEDALRHVYDLATKTWAHSKAQKLDLFIYSRGGHSDVPWALMGMLREIIGKNAKIGALIPYRCHSAATIAVLGADELVMGKKAELGPIDTTMTGPYNPQHPKTEEPLPVSVEDVMGYFSLLEKVGCTGSDNKVEGLKAFTQKVHPYALGMVQRLEDQTKLVALQMLASRLKPFSDAENEAIVETLAKRINSHRHAIARHEAIRHVGLTNVEYSETVGLESLLWDLFLAYEEKLDLSSTFYPEDDFWKDENLESKEYVGLPCCYIETEIAARVCRFDVKLTRVREALQTLTIQPQITFPPPNLPAGLDAAQITQFIEQWYSNAAPPLLRQAIADAIDRARKAMTTKGFQRLEHRRRWEDEVPSSAAEAAKTPPAKPQNVPRKKETSRPSARSRKGS
jgi:hypothetical protein